MGIFQEVTNMTSVTGYVGAGKDYLISSLFYIFLYILALPPNGLLAYLSIKPGLISARIKYPTLGMTLANLFGLIFFLIVNIVYLFALYQDIQLSLTFASFLRTILYNTTYVCYFLFPVLAIDQWLMVCHNYTLTPGGLSKIISICFIVPLLVGCYDLLLQETLLYDYMFEYIRISPYSNFFFFCILAPSFFIFSFVCNLFVLSSIIHRQSKSTRKQIGRSLNPRQLQQQKTIVFIYMLQAFMPLILAAPYYAVYVCGLFGYQLDNSYFIFGDAIIGLHPLTNASTTLFLLKPYRKALKKLFKGKTIDQKRYDSVKQHDDQKIKEDFQEISDQRDSTKESIEL
uniref:G_PROTEIN_RECEP_F1_2 domain-containing protein n=1 Tax=Strongyloides papillosus TaxID=174720 RepID=A0A0N5BH24_STREA